jgi:DNA-binding response OmpR family regulator
VSSGVLVVEDDDDLREMLSRLLHLEGFSPSTAGNGAEALALLRGSPAPPRVILLDLMMPVMNGWQFREQQRHDSRLSVIPVIVLSAVAQLNQGFDAAAVLAKPLDFDALLTTLHAHR